MSKLRENNRTVIGVGVKKSTSDLLIANCDEFIFYDDLVRSARQTAKPQPKAPPKKKPAAKKDEQPLPRWTPRSRRRGTSWSRPTRPSSRSGGGREHLGLDDQADDQAEEPGVRRVLPRVQLVWPASRGGRGPGILELERDEKSGGYIIKGCRL